MAFEVESGIPIPTKEAAAKSPTARQWKYPFQTMEVDQSFLVILGEGETEEIMLKRLRAACQNAQVALPGKRWKAKLVDAGIRVWRVADKA